MFSRSGSFRLFRLFGIDVSLHWTWILAAFYQLQLRSGRYSSPAWPVAEYLSLFLIVLMHEFGHALACRSVGGFAERILLWPFGGVAFVQPPPRPGALLWSIVAGPLVNVVLIFPLWGLWHLTGPGQSNLAEFVKTLVLINIVLLVFNLLPIYPLDGGQILRALLWFVVGRARSLMVAAVVGLVGAALIGLGAVYMISTGNDAWILLLLAVLGAMQSLAGFQQARYMMKVLSAPRYAGLYCPNCSAPPPAGPFMPGVCGHLFDPFVTYGTCPACGTPSEAVPCTECGVISPLQLWYVHAPAAPASPFAQYAYFQPYVAPPAVTGTTAASMSATPFDQRA